MAKVILATDQTATPEADTLGKDWYGDFQLFCTTYDSDEVVMQGNDPDDPDTGWITVNFNGVDIKLSRVGAVIDVKLARDIDYRLHTAEAGAKVVIAIHNPHG